MKLQSINDSFNLNPAIIADSRKKPKGKQSFSISLSLGSSKLNVPNTANAGTKLDIVS